jgi:MYXO-CTERM domain-containing protein
MSTHPGGTVVVFAWLAVGAALAFRRRPVVSR